MADAQPTTPARRSNSNASANSTTMLGKAGRSLKSGTFAAGMAVGSTLAYVTPHLNGAIDIMAVRQPDGTIKTSPFYVRFGKYTGSGVQNRAVKIIVNDVEADFTMHLGRTGEAFFLGEEVEDGSGDVELTEEQLSGMMSPPPGYSSQEDRPPYATAEQVVAIREAVEDIARLESAVASGRAQPGEVDRLKHAADHAVEDLRCQVDGEALAAAARQEGLILHEDGYERSPPATPVVGNGTADAEHAADPASLTPASFARARSDVFHTPAGSRVHSMEFPRIIEDAGNAVEASAGAERPGHSQGGTLGDKPSPGIGRVREQSGADAAATCIPPVQPPDSGPQKAGSPTSDGGQPPAPAAAAAPPPGAASGADASSSAHSSRHGSMAEQAAPDAISRHAPAGTALDAEPDSNAEGDPLHPWSLARPTELAVPNPADAAPTTISLADASAPVGDSMAHSKGATAIPAVADRDSDTASSDLSNRMQLASIERLVEEGAAAPAAVREAAGPVSDIAESKQPQQLSRAADHAALDGVGSAESQEASPAAGTSEDHHLAESAFDPMAGHAAGSDSSTTALSAAAPDSSAANGDAAPGEVSKPVLSSNPVGSEQHAASTMVQQPGSGVEAAHSVPPASLDQHAASSEYAAPTGSTADAAAQGVSDYQADRNVGAEPADDAAAVPNRLATTSGKEGSSTLQQRMATSVDEEAEADAGPGSAASSQSFYDDEETPFSQHAEQQQQQQQPPLGVQPASGERVQNPAVPDSLLGTSPSEGYWADSEAVEDRQRPLNPAASCPSPASHAAKRAAPDGTGSVLGTLQMSMCGPTLRPDMSPEEAWQAFQASRVDEAVFAANAVAITGSPHLWVCIGGRLHPWSSAAPAVLGLLAFGTGWDGALSGGLRIPEPGAPDETAKQAALRRSSWRFWPFRSSASRKDSTGVAAATAVEGDAAEAQQPEGASPRGSRPGDGTQEGKVQLEPSGGLLRSASSTGSRKLKSMKRLRRHRRSFVPTLEQLGSLPLHDGQNTIEFAFGRERERAFVYLLPWNTRLVISDVDGTITRSDLLGHLVPMMSSYDWAHSGITHLFHNIQANGYRFMFLSSRAIAQASTTRDYLQRLNQDGHRLPAGPVIISPDGLLPSLYRELVLRRPHEFKIRCLEDIRALFPPEWQPFYAGFGNRDTDEISYLAVGIPAAKILIINNRSELRKASSIVVTSTWRSLGSINALVDAMFPPLREHLQEKSDEAAQPEDYADERDEFRDLNFWSVPPPLILDDSDKEAKAAN